MAQDKQLVEESEFSHLVLLYLEDQHSEAQLRQLEKALSEDPAKRDLFVEICLTRHGFARLLRNRMEIRKESERKFLLLDQEKATVSSDLTETMIMPAITYADIPADTDVAIDLNPVRSINPVKPSSWWRSPEALAAAVILPILSVSLLWYASGRNRAHKPLAKTSSNQISPEQAVQPYVPTTQPIASANPPVIPAVVAAPPIATVQTGLNATWDHGAQSLEPGAELKSGRHSLEQGIGQIKLAGGATLVIQAPAEFEIQSGTLFGLTQGRLSAMVPHGSEGLTVRTPDMVAIDLGTEFGVNLSASEKKTHLEVFNGKVQAGLTASPTVTRILGTDEAIDVHFGSSKIESGAPAPLEYIRIDELTKRASDDHPLQRWQAFSGILRRDPDLVAYYTFDKQPNSPQKLINESAATIGQHDGTLGVPGTPGTQPQWSQGRWGKGALKFGEHGASAVVIPASNDLIQTNTFSIAFWIKRSELTLPVHLFNQGFNSRRSFNISLIGTAGKGSKQEPNSIYFDFAPGSQNETTRVLPADGNWIFLALTLGADHVKHVYVDGKLVGTGNLQIPDYERTRDLYLGRTSLDNTAGDDPADFFQGCIDELAIFRRELSNGEIQRMYESGRPQ